jgi:hypothetical protein
MPAQVPVIQASLAQPPAVPPRFVPETSTVIEIPAPPEPHLQIPDGVKVPVATGLIRGVAQNAAKVVIAQVTRHTIPDVVAQPVITEAPSEQQSVTPAAAIPELPTTDVQCQEPVLNEPPVASAHLQQATVATAPLPLASEKPGQRAPDAASDVPASQPEQVPQTLPPAVPAVKTPFAVQNQSQPQLATAQPIATAAPSARLVMNAVDRLLALGQHAWPPHEIMAAIGHPAKSVTQSPASAEHRQASATQSLIPVVEPLESPDNPASDLAFTMRLNPTEPTRPVTTAAVTPPPTPVISDAPTPALPNPAPIVAPVESQPAEVPAVAPTIVHPAATAPVAPAKQQKPRSDDEPELPHTDPKPPVLTRSIPPSAAETTAQSGRTVAEPQTQKAEPTRPAELVPPEPPAETKPAGAVRDIKLQVAGGSQRVEVRLTERGGEVQVAVRTPDSHLAGTLRENLPTLSTRLADNGFRADTWHPAAPAAEWRRSTETSQGNLAQEQNPHSGGQQEGQQSGGDARQPRAPEAPSERKEKRKDFAWLMSNLQ